eukprot:scaffold4517_cov170-Alexandrium_tamarense.AAC.8
MDCGFCLSLQTLRLVEIVTKDIPNPDKVAILDEECYHSKDIARSIRAALGKHTISLLSSPSCQHRISIIGSVIHCYIGCIGVRNRSIVIGFDCSSRIRGNIGRSAVIHKVNTFSTDAIRIGRQWLTQLGLEYLTTSISSIGGRGGNATHLRLLSMNKKSGCSDGIMYHCLQSFFV